MRRFVLCLVALLSAAFCLNAQESRATISGLVTDSSGAAVPDAQVSAINLETGLTVKSQANGQGLYVIPYLLPGQYKVQVERAGFKSFDQGPIILRVADRVEINAVLQVGQMTERISVVADAALVETETSSRGQVIDNQRDQRPAVERPQSATVCGPVSRCAVRGQLPNLLPAFRYATGFYDQWRPARRQ